MRQLDRMWASGRIVRLTNNTGASVRHHAAIRLANFSRVRHMLSGA
jgi:hypothetical protein